MNELLFIFFLVLIRKKRKKEKKRRERKVYKLRLSIQKKYIKQKLYESGKGNVLIWE